MEIQKNDFFGKQDYSSKDINFFEEELNRIKNNAIKLEKEQNKLEKEKLEKEQKKLEKERLEKEQKKLEEEIKEKKIVKFDEIVQESPFIENIENKLNDDTSEKKNNAMKIIIEGIKTANLRGGFELEESEAIYTSIAIVIKKSETPQEIFAQNEAAEHLIKASKISNKRGCFKIEESYEISLACKVFF